MKKNFLVLFAFLFFVLPNFSINAAVDIPEIPAFPNTPSGYDKYALSYCDSSCSYDYSNRFVLVFYDVSNNFGITSINSESKVVMFNNARTYLYVNEKWILYSDSYSNLTYKKLGSSGLTFVKTNDSVLKEKVGEDFFLKVPPVVGAVEQVPMGGVLKVVLEVLPIVVSLIVSCLALRKAFQWLLLQLKGC